MHVSAHQRQPAHPLGVARGKLHRKDRPRREARQVEGPELRGIGDGSEIIGRAVEIHRRQHRLGLATAAVIIAQQPTTAPHRREKRQAIGVAPVELQTGRIVPGQKKRRAVAGHRIGQARAIPCAGKPDALTAGGGRRGGLRRIRSGPLPPSADRAAPPFGSPPDVCHRHPPSCGRRSRVPTRSSRPGPPRQSRRGSRHGLHFRPERK